MKDWGLPQIDNNIFALIILRYDGMVFGRSSLVYGKSVNPKLETGAGATIVTLFKPQHQV